MTRTASTLSADLDLDDDLVFVEFASVPQVEGHGFPVEIGPQHDAHADAWLDALELNAASGFRAQPFTVATDPAEPVHTIADMERDSLALFLGFRAELEERLALAPAPVVAADALLADIAARINAQVAA